MHLFFNKKAQSQTNTAVGAVIFLVIGIGIAVMTLVMTGTLSGEVYQSTESDIDNIANNVVTAESLFLNNVTNTAFANTYVQQSTLVVYNSSGTSFGLGNFTIDYDSGLIRLATVDTIPNGTTVLANYTSGAVSVRNSIKNGISSSFEAMQTTGDYMPLVVLAFIIVLILGLIVGLTSVAGVSGGRGGGAL